MNNILQCPQGSFTLDYYPPAGKQPLRAWDAADEYLLSYLHAQNLLDSNPETVIVNDRHGALTVTLANLAPVFISDSYIARTAAKQNLQANSMSVDNVIWLNSLKTPTTTIDLLILKIPNNLALLEEQLIRLKPKIGVGTVILAGGMSKSIHTSTLDLFSKIIGPTTTSLAKKKARLIFSHLDSTLPVVTSPYPLNYSLEKPVLHLSNHANVFSQKRLDIGTRFLLDYLPQDKAEKDVLDLGCGNGVLGIAYALQNPESKLTFTDESYMAVASARLNFQHAFNQTRTAGFEVTDCLDNVEAQFDLILNNPPFHQQNVITDAIAWKMFRQSRAKLRPEGRLRVVGNRHLAYHVKLKKLFGNVKTIASNRKFVILDAIRSG